MMGGKWVMLLAVAMVVGCATTVSVASPESDAAAKRFEPPAGKANIYVARSHDSFGGAGLFKLTVDGKPLGSIAAGTFYLAVIDPGKHGITASSIANSAKATLVAESGKNYFYEVTAASGVPELNLVLIEEMGKMMVRQAKLARGDGE